MSIVRDDGAMDLYHGNLRIIDQEGEIIHDGIKRLMTTADRALFRAKAEGRNRVVLATREDDRL